MEIGRFIEGQKEIGVLFGISEGNLDMYWIRTKGI